MTAQPGGPTAAAAPSPPRPEFNRNAALVLTASVGVTSMAFNLWWPFLPLYALDLGARSDADALFWVAVATAVQGVARLATVPVWGVMSDRYGRKLFYLRSLFLGTLTFFVAALITEPWQLMFPLALQGALSGFGPAAVALVSVSVPDSRLTSSLSLVTGAQYIGNTVGPAVGAVLAITIGYKATILATSVLPLLAGAAVLLAVPSDQPSGRRERNRPRPPLEPFRLTYQFALAVLVYFVLIALNQLIRLATPIALGAIEGRTDVAGVTGLTFTLAGLFSTLSVLFVAPRFFRTGRLRRSLGVCACIAAAGFLFLAAAQVTAAYIAGFLTIAIVLSAMIPTTNTLMAANVTRSRRGTGFGIAGSAQAISFVVGPAGAAVFAVISFEAGFALLAGLLVALAALVTLTMREPDLQGAQSL